MGVYENTSTLITTHHHRYNHRNASLGGERLDDQYTH